MRIRIVTLLALSLIAPFAGASPSTDLGALLAAYSEEAFALDPIAATRSGEHRFDDRPPRPETLATVAMGLELERRYASALAAIDASQLSAEERLSVDSFARERRLTAEGYRYQAELLPLQPDGGLPFALARLGSGDDAEPFATVRDYEHWLARLAGMQPWVAQAIVNLRRGAAKGVVEPRALIESLLPELELLISADPAASVFYRPLEHLPEGTSAADAERLRNAYLAMIRDRLTPAYRALYTFLHDDYLPMTRLSVGFSELPLGREWYAYRVRRVTGTELTPEAVHAAGLKEVARLAVEADRALLAHGFKGDRAAFAAALAADPKAVFEHDAELLAGVEDLKGRVRARLTDLFDLAPTSEFEIRARSQGSASDAAVAYYRRVPPLLILNTRAPGLRERHRLESIYLAEAEPGRRFAAALAAESALPAFRRGGSFPGYEAGWAAYAASLGRELGLYTDPAQYFGCLSTELSAAALLVADTGIHARRWTRAQALTYYTDSTQASAGEAAAAIERVIASPAAALAGPVGLLRIRALKERSERELGARFDLVAFHRAVLESGPLPLEVLDQKIARWSAARRAAR